MQKQIIYSGFINRLFASTIDISLFSLLTLPFTNLLGNKIFSWCFSDYFIKHNLNISDITSVTNFFAGFSKFGVEEWSLLNLYFSITLSANFIFMGICYLSCWFKWGNTPGKALLQLKIVDKDSLQPINRIQYIKRYFGYILSMFNIFIMPMDKRTRGMQDFIAGTVVIKR